MTDQPKTTKELFVTIAALDEYRKENSSEHASFSIELKSGLKQLNARCDQIEAKFDVRCDKLEAKIDSNFEKLCAIAYRTQAMVEELKNEMRYLMDSHQRLWDKVNELDQNKMDKADFPSF